jgi:hypothetical protein
MQDGSPSLEVEAGESHRIGHVELGSRQPPVRGDPKRRRSVAAGGEVLSPPPVGPGVTHGVRGGHLSPCYQPRRAAPFGATRSVGRATHAAEDVAGSPMQLGVYSAACLSAGRGLDVF